MRSALALVLLGCCSLSAAQTLSPEVRKFVKIDAPVVRLDSCARDRRDGSGGARGSDRDSQQGED